MDSHLREIKLLNEKEMELWRQYVLGDLQKNRNVFPISYHFKMPVEYDNSKRISGKEFDNWIIKKGYSVGSIEGSYFVLIVPITVADNFIVTSSFCMKNNEVRS